MDETKSTVASSPVSSPIRIRLLLIPPGTSASHRTCLGEHFDIIDIPSSIVIPEPADDEGLHKGVGLLQQLINDHQPDILVGSSRGGQYAARLISRGLWKSLTLLISSMATAEALLSSSSNAPPCLVLHGSKDGTNPITRVREEVNAAFTHAKLIEVDDDHSLTSICGPNAVLVGAVHELVSFSKQYSEAKQKASSTTSSTQSTSIRATPSPAKARFALLDQIKSKSSTSTTTKSTLPT